MMTSRTYEPQQSALRINFLNMFKKLDMFQEDVPGFNVRGIRRVRSCAGGFFSFIVLSVTFAFALLKGDQLLSRFNPSINQFNEEDYYTNDDRLSLADTNFNMAFAIEDHYLRESRHDPRYLKWAALYIQRMGKQETRHELPMYPCTPFDYDKFFPVEERSRAQLEEIRNNPKRELLCIDWSVAEAEIYGTQSSGVYGTLDIVAMPCNMDLRRFGIEDPRIDPECKWDLEDQINYLGPPDLLVYENKEKVMLS